MARLRVESAPEFVVYDESAVIKAAANATANLLELKNSSNTVVASVSTARNLSCWWGLVHNWQYKRYWHDYGKRQRQCIDGVHIKF